MDEMERVRIAGAFVEFLRSLGYSDADVIAASSAMCRHVAVQREHGPVPESTCASPKLAPSRN